MTSLCVDSAPFSCVGAQYLCVRNAVTCRVLSSAFCTYQFEDVWEVLPDRALAGHRIADLCPQSCDLCDPECEHDLGEVASLALISPTQLAASRERPNNNTCVVSHWIGAVRKAELAQPTLTRTMLARALLGVLEARTLRLSSCATSRRVCHAGKHHLQSWVVDPLRTQPLQSCPESGGDAHESRGDSEVMHEATPTGTEALLLSSTIHLSAHELASRTLHLSTQQRARRSLRKAGLAVIVGGLESGPASSLRRMLLSDTNGLRRTVVLEASHREHLLLEPDEEAVARVLTSLGVRAGPECHQIISAVDVDAHLVATECHRPSSAAGARRRARRPARRPRSHRARRRDDHRARVDHRAGRRVRAGAASRHRDALWRHDDDHGLHHLAAHLGGGDGARHRTKALSPVPRLGSSPCARKPQPLSPLRRHRFASHHRQLGALSVVPGSHSTGCREPTTECDAALLTPSAQLSTASSQC